MFCCLRCTTRATVKLAFCLAEEKKFSRMTGLNNPTNIIIGSLCFFFLQDVSLYTYSRPRDGSSGMACNFLHGVEKTEVKHANRQLLVARFPENVYTSNDCPACRKKHAVHSYACGTIPTAKHQLHNINATISTAQFRRKSTDRTIPTEQYRRHDK